MVKEIKLNEKGILVYYGCLFMHDYLWFSSSEISRISTTIPVIHNYALSYAVQQFSYAIYRGNSPKYCDDMKEFKCYATPALSIGSKKQSFVYNAIDDMWQTTGRAEIKINSPDFGIRTVIAPEFANVKDKDKLTKFSFYLFLWEEYKPPSIVRLGKKNAIARIFWEEIKNPIGIYMDNEILPGHSVNPYDISGTIKRGDIVKIPPHSFYRSVTISNDWFIISNYSRFRKHIIHVPKKIINKFTNYDS